MSDVDPDETLRACEGCGEEWYEDDEFYRPLGSPLCRACVWEQEEDRRRQQAEATRRYRSRRREAIA